MVRVSCIEGYTLRGFSWWVYARGEERKNGRKEGGYVRERKERNGKKKNISGEGME